MSRSCGVSCGSSDAVHVTRVDLVACALALMVARRRAQAAAGVAASSACQLEDPAVLDEAAAVGHLVVELHRVRVALVGEPPDPRAAQLRCALVDVLDQGATDAPAA